MDMNWKDITIEKWQQLNSVKSDNELTTLIERMSILIGEGADLIRQKPFKEFNELVTKYSFLGEEPSSKYKLTFTLDGVEYGIIPDFSEISTGEWVDIEEFKKDSIKNCHLILALLYRPITKRIKDTWEIEPHTSKGFMKRADLFRTKLSVEDVLGAVLFFSHIAIQFIQNLEPYLKEEKKKMMKTTQTRTRIQKSKKKSL
jgi:hypothetical protein